MCQKPTVQKITLAQPRMRDGAALAAQVGWHPAREPTNPRHWNWLAPSGLQWLRLRESNPRVGVGRRPKVSNSLPLSRSSQRTFDHTPTRKAELFGARCRPGEGRFVIAQVVNSAPCLFGASRPIQLVGNGICSKTSLQTEAFAAFHWRGSYAASNRLSCASTATAAGRAVGRTTGLASTTTVGSSTGFATTKALGWSNSHSTISQIGLTPCHSSL